MTFTLNSGLHRAALVVHLIQLRGLGRWRPLILTERRLFSCSAGFESEAVLVAASSARWRRLAHFGRLPGPAAMEASLGRGLDMAGANNSKTGDVSTSPRSLGSAKVVSGRASALARCT